MCSNVSGLENIGTVNIQHLTERTNCDVFEYKNSYVIKGNSLDENLFNEEFIDLIVTSPPYNVGMEYNSNDDELAYSDYLDFSRKWISNCFKWSKKSGRFALNIPLDKNKGGHHSVCADLTTIAKEVGWKYHSTIVWNEGNISRRTAWGSWLSASAPYIIAPVEMIVLLYKESWKKDSKDKKNDIEKKEFMDWTSGIWSFNGESAKRIKHPAPFPKELPKRCIKLLSFLGDVVFDPFLGSGTTVIEAINNKRIGVGIELDSTYYELIKNRIQNETMSIEF